MLARIDGLIFRTFPYLMLAGIFRLFVLNHFMQGPGLFLGTAVVMLGAGIGMLASNYDQPGVWLLSGFFALFVLLMLLVGVFGIARDVVTIGPKEALGLTSMSDALNMAELLLAGLVLLWLVRYFIRVTRYNWRVASPRFPIFRHSKKDVT